MRLPSFTGEASLYKTGRFYRGYSGPAGGDATQSVVLAQQNCGLDCWTGCGLSDAACVAQALATCPGGDFFTVAACLLGKCGIQTLSTALCIYNCPRCGSCDTCTNCHSTDIGWCFCDGQNCGWNSPCCASPPGGGGGG